jgi:hypothetical protein
MPYYLFAFGSLLVGLACLFLSRNKKYFANLEGKYGEAAVQKLTRSLKNWGYFFLFTSVVLLVSLSLQCLR